MTDERVFERTIEKRSAVRSGGPGVPNMPINSGVPSRADPNAVEWAAVRGSSDRAATRPREHMTQ